MSLEMHNKIVAHCAARTGCAHFGLLVGQHDGLHSFGLVGLLVRYAHDVREALNSFIRYFHLHAQGASVNLVVDDHSAMLTWQITDPGIEAVDHVSDGAIAVLLNIMRDLCGPDFRPTEAWFAHRMPADAGPFRRFFRVPLRFDAEQYALLFPVGYLNHHLNGIDDELRAVLQAQIGMLEQRHGNDFPAQVRSVLGASLLAGHCKAEQIAALFGMHSRTLNRRLSSFDVSFQQLVDQSRFEIARQMLEYSAMDIAQVSDALGYAAPGVFTRAFRRWSGTTPVEWRLAHGHGTQGLARARKPLPSRGPAE